MLNLGVLGHWAGYHILMESHNGVMCMKASRRYLPFRCCIFLLCICSVLPTALESDDCWMVHLHGLKNADCDNKRITKVPQDVDHDIKVFRLQQNQITVLTDNEFERYPSLQEIYLTGNRIDTLYDLAFKGLENLQVLDLERNELKDVPSGTFKYIPFLRILRLKSNQIHSILEDSFKALTKLEQIDLENCYISYIHPKAFLGLEQLDEINIANNDLKMLDATMEYALPKSLRTFRIHDNKWICDCKLRWLRIWTSNSSTNWEFNRNTPDCSGPPILRGITWKSLSADQFACAPHIVQTNRTDIEVSLQSNVTIECIITGDPLPTIIWTQNSKVYTQAGNIKTTSYFHAGKKYTKTILSLLSVQQSDMGAYKCIAKNLQGSAEFSYSVSLLYQPPKHNDIKKQVLIWGLKKNFVIGICIVIGVLLLIFLTVICFFLCYTTNKRRRQKRAYKVREYQRPGNNVNKEEMLQVNDKATTKSKTKSNRYAGSNSDKQLLAEKQELLREKPPQNDATEIKNSVPEEINPTDNQFKMKIFTNYGDEGNTKSQEQAANLPPPPPDETIHQPSLLAEGGHVKVRPDRDTPDLLKDRIITNRAIPVPPPSVPNHIQSTHPRARENPYVTASELKASTLKKKTASADDLLDGCEGDQQFPGDKARRSCSRDDILQSPNTSANPQPKKTRFQEPVVKQRDHSSTCTNPVCMKDTLSSPPQKLKPEQTFKHSQGGGGYYSKGTQREIDVDNLSSPDSRYDSLGYKTIPARLNKCHPSPEPTHFSPPTSSHGSPSKSINPDSKTLPKRFHIPSKTVSFSEEGHPIIDLTQEMPEPIVITGFDTRNKGQTKPNTSGMYSTLPHTTKAQQPGQNKRVQVTGSPSGEPSKTPQGTTLDDLLSPPFGQSPSGSRKLTSQTLPRKKSPKPGEKDEFGTAV